MAENFFSLIKGPGLTDLVFALFNRVRDGFVNPQTVFFETADNREFEVVITGLAINDSAGKSWDFEGTLSRSRHENGSHVRGYWATDRRGGFLHIVPTHVFRCEEPEKGA